MGLFLMGAFTVMAGNKTEKFDVKGNCGMCEKRIEKAALSVNGVSKAEWDKSTKQIEVTFNNAKTNTKAIQKAIVAVGHDAGKLKASDEVYDELPGCCKYDRADEKQDPHDGHKH